MALQSNFSADLEQERKLSFLLDKYYQKHLKKYSFERVNNLKRQLQGIDLIFTQHTTGQQFFVDEKAQLDYINESLPTFAFELFYNKGSKTKKGWLFDISKKTDFYALVTSIYSDFPDTFTSSKITFVNRLKLIDFLEKRNITQKYLNSIINEHPVGGAAKMKIVHLDHRTQGYLYFSTKNKAEKPINLILKLDFLVQNGIAKPFV
ncbi:MAG: hypothetical protein WBM83_01620 [Flavobacteriaceae bacterium]